jgi:hypothetical protein
MIQIDENFMDVFQSSVEIRYNKMSCHLLDYLGLHTQKNLREVFDILENVGFYHLSKAERTFINDNWIADKLIYDKDPLCSHRSPFRGDDR